MDLLTKFTRWADYSGAQLALADIDEKYADAYVEELMTMGLLQGMFNEDDDSPKSKRPTVTELRASKKADPVYREAVNKRLEAYARRKLIAARHEAFERGASVVSRELSRRIERDPSARRTARMGGAR